MPDSCVVSLTTTPQRIQSDFMQHNLQRLRTLAGDCRVILNVPHRYSKTGELYHVDKVQNVPGIEIHRCEDVGPATKLIPTLHNPSVPADATVVLVDDDIVYKDHTVQYLVESVREDPSKIYGYNTQRELEGFSGLAGRKSVLEPLAQAPPEACKKVDDMWFTHLARQHKIPTQQIAYEGLMGGFSSMDPIRTNREKAKEGRGWEELNHTRKNDDQRCQQWLASSH